MCQMCTPWPLVIDQDHDQDHDHDHDHDHDQAKEQIDSKCILSSHRVNFPFPNKIQYIMWSEWSSKDVNSHLVLLIIWTISNQRTLILLLSTGSSFIQGELHGLNMITNVHWGVTHIHTHINTLTGRDPYLIINKLETKIFMKIYFIIIGNPQSTFDFKFPPSR